MYPCLKGMPWCVSERNLAVGGEEDLLGRCSSRNHSFLESFVRTPVILLFNQAGS